MSSIGNSNGSSGLPSPSGMAEENSQADTHAASFGGVSKWNEVCERVQQADGAVRTSFPIPPKLRPLDKRLGQASFSKPGENNTASTTAVSAGESSRGSSEKSSRASSHDARACEGDVSSGCSSGGWDTSTNSSEPRRLAAPAAIRGLHMPMPVRSTCALFPAFLEGEAKAEASAFFAESSEPDRPCQPEVLKALCAPPVERPLMPIAPFLVRDPFGRDCGSSEADGGHKRGGKPRGEWTASCLTRFLREIAAQIDRNLQERLVPSSDKLDKFVSRLVAHTHTHIRRAPRRQRHALQDLFGKSFRKYWNWAQNQKVRATSPEEIKTTLAALTENLAAENYANTR